MLVSEVETNAAGEVVGYSCPECGSALVQCHDLDYERTHGPQQTEARFACVHCEEETEEPTLDPQRTAERLYSVRVEIAWNDQGDGNILSEAEELTCFESESEARWYVEGLFQAVFDAEHAGDVTVETQPD